MRSVRVRGIDRTMETAPDQLRLVLVRLRELLIQHPRVLPDPARVRFVGYGSSSLDVEVFAYVATQDRNEFNSAPDLSPMTYCI